MGVGVLKVDSHFFFVNGNENCLFVFIENDVDVEGEKNRVNHMTQDNQSSSTFC